MKGESLKAANFSWSSRLGGVCSAGERWDKMRGSAQDFCWKTLKTFATRSASRGWDVGLCGREGGDSGLVLAICVLSRQPRELPLSSF